VFDHLPSTEQTIRRSAGSQTATISKVSRARESCHRTYRRL